MQRELSDKALRETKRQIDFALLCYRSSFPIIWRWVAAEEVKNLKLVNAEIKRRGIKP